MNEFNSDVQESKKFDPLELGSSNTVRLDSPTEVVQLGFDSVLNLSNLLSEVLAELKIPLGGNLDELQAIAREPETNRESTERSRLCNMLASLLNSHIEVYHDHGSADASNSLHLSADLRRIWIFLGVVSQLRSGTKGLGYNQVDLIHGFGVWLGHLNYWIEFSILRQSAQYHSQQYDQLRNIDDLNNAVSFYEQALARAAPSHLFFQDIVLDLDGELKKRYEHLGDQSDLFKSIECLSVAATRLRNNHPTMVTVMDRLGVSHMRLFQCLGNQEDIEQALGYLKRAVSLTQEKDEELLVHLSNLASCYQARFTRVNGLNDLNEAIVLLEKVVVATSPHHDKLPGYLNNLGSAYSRRYTGTGAIEDLTRAVDCLSHSTRLFSKNNPHLPSALHFLACSLEARCRYSGNLEDLDQAIECYTQAILLTPSGHMDMPTRLNALGGALINRFECLGEWADIEKSVEFLQKAVYLTPAEHADMPSRLSTLGTALNNRFNYSGDIQDNHRAVECHKKAVQLTPKGHASLHRYLFGLGTAYLYLFDRLGHVEHADWAIENLTHAAALTSDASEKPKPLTNLAKAYSGIYQRLGQAEDLDRAIHYQVQAVELSSEGHSGMPEHLCNLGVYFHLRFGGSKDLRDLDNAIICERRALELAHDNHAQKANMLSSLGHAYTSRFEATRQVDDINTAVGLLEQAIVITPEDHADRPKRLNNLGSILTLQFSALHTIEILDKSIEVLSLAVSSSSPQDASSPGFLYNLARRYTERFEHLEDYHSLFQAIRYFKLCAESPIGDLQARFQASHMLAGILSHISLTQSLAAYQIAFNMIPQLIWLGATIDTRYKDIPQIDGMIQDAVTVAMKAKNYVLALEWLEQGRSLAEKLKVVSVSLHSASSSSRAQTLGPSTIADFSSSLEQTARNHRSLAAEYDRLLSEIRIAPGFEDFMLPRKASDFFRVANNNPVVVIHAHGSHCGALALLPGYPHVHHIPLPNMTSDKAETARSQLRMSLRRRGVRERSDLRGVKQLSQKDYFRSVLATLWTDVVKPILGELGYMLYPTTQLPHITWCTTGPFSFLPIHAAGYYDRPMSKLSDYAISSYTPTLTALLTMEHNDAQPLSSVLAVGQEATPNKSPLPQTVNELDRIKSRATQSETGYMQLDKDGATVSRVLDALGSYSCVHLACHAHQNLVNPLESGFYLHDGTLTLRTIMQQSFQGKQLAFLSACQTAAGDDQIPDEAVHLASGMLVAGYPSVIATMWSISDYYAPLVADEVYERLMSYGSFKPGATAKALHYAVAKLREEVGDEDFIRWVPYVHFGV